MGGPVYLGWLKVGISPVWLDHSITVIQLWTRREGSSVSEQFLLVTQDRNIDPFSASL